jgi:hypothetical protein
VNRYHRRHLVAQLFHSRRYQDVWELVEDPQWRLAKFKELGSEASFLDDLQWALISAERQQVDGLPRLFQYSLLDTLLRAMAAAAPVAPDRLAGGQDAIQAALEQARAILDPPRRVKALVSVARKAITTGQPAAVGPALKDAELAVEKVSGVLIQTKLLVDIAGVQAGAGQSGAATATLQRVERLLENHLQEEEQRGQEMFRLASSPARKLPPTPSTPPVIKPVVKIPQQKPFIPPWSTQHQMPGIRPSAGPASPWRGVAGIYALAAGVWAAAGRRRQAQSILARLKPVVHQLGVTDLEMVVSDFAAVDGIVAATRQFTALGDHELAAEALDTMPATYGGRARGLLQDLAGELNRLGYTGLALKAVHKIEAPPLSLTDTASLRDGILVDLVPGVDNVDSLKAVAGAAPKTKERRTLTAVALRYVDLGEVGLAAQFARKAGPVSTARLAARLIRQGHPEGTAMFDRALAKGRSQPHRDLKSRHLCRIAGGLAEEGLLQQALTVWQEAQPRPNEPDDCQETIKTVSALAVALTRAGKTKQALRLADSLKTVSERVEAQTVIASTLAGMERRDEAHQIFDTACATARGTLNPEERSLALETLLDSLLKSAEFEMACDVARSLDRLHAMANYADEPGLFFRQAKDWLGRAVGFPEDEDVAIDTAPEFQVKVIIAIAEAGDHQLAARLAAQIKNSSVQDDLKSDIAAAAGRAGDHAAAYTMAATVAGATDREVILEELAAQAAQTGLLSRALLTDKDYRAGRAVAFTAMAARLAAQAQSSGAMTLLEQVVDDLIAQAGEETEEAVASLEELIRFAGQSDYSDGVRHYLKWGIKLLGRDDTPYDLAHALAEIGWADEALKVLRRRPDWYPEDGGASFYSEAGVHLARQGQLAAALAISDQLTGSDDIRECVALQFARQGNYADARQTARAIADRQASSQIYRAIATLEGVGQGQEMARQTVGQLLDEAGWLESLSDDIVAALVFRLVLAGQYPLAQNVVQAIPRPAHPWSGDRREQAVMALVQAAAQRHLGLPGQELIELIETDLSDDSKVAGLARIATWILAEFPRDRDQAIEPLFQAMQRARSQGHYEVWLHLAGLARLLDGLGGPALIQETIGRLQQIEENWF